MNAMIASSSSLIQSTLGFSLTDIVTWFGQRILLILGGGLGLFDGVLGWLIVLAVIGTIFVLVFKPFRFFQNSR